MLKIELTIINFVSFSKIIIALLEHLKTFERYHTLFFANV